MNPTLLPVQPNDPRCLRIMMQVSPAEIERREREQNKLVPRLFDNGEQVVVLAPPGCGKTHMCLQHAKYHFSTNGTTCPAEVLFLTFTNAAVREQRDRLRNMYGETDPDVEQVAAATMRTLHSVAMVVVRALADDSAEPLPAPDYVFDKILSLAQRDPASAAHKVRTSLDMFNVECLYCDEMQDMNSQQHEFVQLLATVVWPDARVVMVGDPRQSIYAFAGATPDLTAKAISGRRVININCCFRCTSAIIDFANDIAKPMGYTPIQPGRDMVGPPPSVRRFDTYNEEMEWVRDKIASLVRTGTKPEDIAILARKHSYTDQGLFIKLILHGIDVVSLRDAYSDGQSGTSSRAGCVTLGTMHASKGNEWKCVFLVGMSDEEFTDDHYEPFDASRAQQELGAVFVGATRAIDHLYLTYATSRFPRRAGSDEPGDSLVRFIRPDGPFETAKGMLPDYWDGPPFDLSADAWAEGSGDQGASRGVELGVKRVPFSPSLGRGHLGWIDEARRSLEEPLRSFGGAMEAVQLVEPLAQLPLCDRCQIHSDVMLAMFLILADELYVLAEDPKLESTERFHTITMALMLPGLNAYARAGLEKMDVPASRALVAGALDKGSCAPANVKRAIKRKIATVYTATDDRQCNTPAAHRKRPVAERWNEVSSCYSGRDSWRKSLQGLDWAHGDDSFDEQLLGDMRQAYRSARAGAAGRRTSIRDLLLLSLMLGLDRDDIDTRAAIRVNAAYKGRTEEQGAICLKRWEQALESIEAHIRNLAHSLHSHLRAGSTDECGLVTDVLRYADTTPVGQVYPIGLMLARINGVAVFVSAADPQSDAWTQNTVSSHTNCVMLLAQSQFPRSTTAVLQMDTGLLVACPEGEATHGTEVEVVQAAMAEAWAKKQLGPRAN